MTRGVSGAVSSTTLVRNAPPCLDPRQEERGSRDGAPIEGDGRSALMEKGVRPLFVDLMACAWRKFSPAVASHAQNQLAPVRSRR